MKIVIASLVAVLLPVASATSEEGDHRRFPASGFDRIELAGCDNVSVMAGPTFAVVAGGRPASLDAIQAEVRGGVLRLTRAPGTCDGRAGRPAAAIAVTLPRLRAVTTSGTGNMRIGSPEAPAFEAVLSGTGNLAIAGLRARTARIDLSGTGDVTLYEVAVSQLLLRLSGTGQIEAKGSAVTLMLDAKGTGEIDTGGLAARDVRVDMSGTGGVRARADATAQIDASGMGRATIAGHPRCTIRKSGFARVTCG